MFFDVLISLKNLFDEVIKWQFRQSVIRRFDPVSKRRNDGHLKSSTTTM